MLSRLPTLLVGKTASSFQSTNFLNNQTRCMGMATAAVAGASSIAALMTARWFYRTWQAMQRTARITGASPFTYYYRGGFEPKMSKREAAMILGIREFSRPTQIKDAHRRIMIVNHPDRGGSPYLAMKVNEAKTILENANN